MYGPYTAYKEGGTPFNMVENIAYGTFSRTAWGLAIAWVIYACQNGYGGEDIVIANIRFSLNERFCKVALLPNF